MTDKRSAPDSRVPRVPRVPLLKPLNDSCLAALFGLAVALWGTGPVQANFPPDGTNLEHQLAQTTSWGSVRVTNLRFTGVPARLGKGPKPGTWVDFEFVDVDGKTLSKAALWHLGADTEGGVWTSRMPRFEIGAYYVVLLRWTNDRFQLVEDAMSVVQIENLMPGVLSPWDAVRFDRWHGFVPAGATVAVTDAQLHEVLDGLAILESRVKGATGGTP